MIVRGLFCRTNEERRLASLFRLSEKEERGKREKGRREKKRKERERKRKEKERGEKTKKRFSFVLVAVFSLAVSFRQIGFCLLLFSFIFLFVLDL